MKSTLAALAALASGSQALVAREAGCCFGIQAYGEVSGPVEQLSDGQNRLQQANLPLGWYCTTSDGGIVDSQGRGCILTPPTGQWQCDAGASPTTGFSIGPNGTISYQGESTWWTCPTEQDGGWNIHGSASGESPTPEQPKCVPAWLLADACHAEETMTSTITAPCSTTYSETTPCTTMATTTSSECSYSTSSSTSECTYTTSSSTSEECTYTSSTSTSECTYTPTSTSSECSYSSSTSTSCSATPTMEAKQCPLELPSGFEFPHLIVPVCKQTPDEAYGTSYNGTVVGEDVSSIFNFDLPSSMADKTCTLVFSLPEHGQMETSEYELSGDATFTFSYLSDVANQQTTWSNMGPVHDVLNTITMTPGNSYVISEKTGCNAGKTDSFLMQGQGSSYINYFQDSNPCPIGLWVLSS